MDPQVYSVDSLWENSTKGIVCSPESNAKNGISIEVTAPLELNKGIPGIWSPEHLIVAAVSSSLMTGFLSFAENSTLQFTGFSCEARGIMEEADAKLLLNEIILKPVVVIHSQKYLDKTRRLLLKAEDVCPLRHTIRAKITMEISIVLIPILIENT